MAAPAIPARSSFSRLASWIVLLACLLPLFPCNAQSMAMPAQAHQAEACHPCCPSVPASSATALCCTVHPQDATVVSQAVSDPPLLQRSLILLAAPHAACSLAQPVEARLTPFRPPPLLSLRI